MEAEEDHHAMVRGTKKKAKTLPDLNVGHPRYSEVWLGVMPWSHPEAKETATREEEDDEVQHNAADGFHRAFIRP